VARERASACSFSSSRPAPGRSPGAWTFGAAEIDGYLPWQGLAASGLHEIKPETPADGPAAQALAMLLLARQLTARSDEVGTGSSEERATKQGSRTPARPEPALLWAMTWRGIGEAGRPYGPGLAPLGLDPGHVLFVEARRDSEVAWVLEEGLRSQALAGVLGGVTKLDMTAARRLALAAATHTTPCLLLTPARGPGVPVAMSRWRVGATSGGRHALEPGLPAGLRLRLTLERCRGREADRSWIVEWSDATFRFRLAAALADRAARPDLARRRAG
jgi:protein ImuA